MNPRKGIVLKILSALCATLMLACVKGLDGAIPTGQVVFFRSFLALFPLLLWLNYQGNVRASLKTKNILGHLIRGFSGTGGMFFNYLALVYISLADATALSYAAPLFTVIMAALLLKEQVRLYRWIAVIIGFSGILIMLAGPLRHSVSTATAAASFGVIFALLAALCTATSLVQIRFLNGIEHPGAIVFYFSLMTTVIGLATSLFGWCSPSPLQWALLIGCGLLGGVAQILVTLSLRYADASLLAPFDYTTLLWSMLIGFVMLGAVPSMTTVTGAAIVAGAGLFALWGDRRWRNTRVAVARE